MIEFLIALLVIGLFVGPKLIKLLPRQTATAPQAGAAAPSPPAPISKWVKWLAGGIAAILVLTLLWWAWPTTSVPTPSVTDQSSIGKFLSELDLSSIPFGQTVTELVGATWAPIVLIIAALLIITAIVWLFRKGGETIVVVVLLLVLALGVYWGVKAYIQDATKSLISIDMRRVPLGETVVKRIHTSSTMAIRVPSTSRAVYGFTRTWPCPNVDGSVEFVMESGLDTTLHYYTVSKESQKILGDVWVDAAFTMTVNPENPCGHLTVR